MTDYPVLISTSFGPVEGVVSEPDDGRRRAALVITHANGRAGRWGTNSVWARTARRLAERGLVVLRADYARGIDSGRDPDRGETAVWERDLLVRAEINRWFAQRTGAQELFMAGICRGARVAISLAAENVAIAGLLLIAPPLLEPAARRGWLARRLRTRDGQEQLRIDPRAERDLLGVIERIPVTMICSDREAGFFERSLSSRALELELISGPRLNRMESPEVQTSVLEHTVSWGSRRAVEPVPAAVTAGD